MQNTKIFTMAFARVYPLYVAKVEKKGRTQAEVDTIIFWLTGYDSVGLEQVLTEGRDFETFFRDAPRLNPARTGITGTICGYRIEDMENGLMKEIRILDKLIDELARGKSIARITQEK